MAPVPPSDDPLARFLRREGVETLELATANALDVIGVVDRDLVVRYVNWTAADISREDVIGGSALDLAPPSYRDLAEQIYRDVLRTGVGSRFDILYQDAGHTLMWDVRVGPIRIDQSIAGLIVITSDVTEQRRARADRDRFFSLSLDMLIVAGPDGHLKRVNPAFGETLGYDVSALEGTDFVSLVHPDDRAESQEAVAAILEGSRVRGFENRYRHANGTYRVLSWRATVDPVTGDLYAVARDITDHRATETQLRHAQKMEAVGQLAGGVAHDFNNLLQAILGNTDLAMGTGAEDAYLADRLADIRSAANRAASLTKQLLAFSRRQMLRPVAIDLRDVARGMMKLLRRLIPANIEIELVAGDGIASVNADPTQIEQVIVNLCVNARDAMDHGGHLTLEIGNVSIDRAYCDAHPWAKPGDYVRLSVSDTGLGMPPEVLERIFEPFFTTKGPHRGTGLGLSTVYGILEQHEGMIHVRSEVGVGTTFEVYLPATSRPASAVVPTLQGFPARGHETILLAEDDEIVRRAVVEMLRRAGYRTLVASDGLEAVRLLGEHDGPVHLALLDVVMPGLAGIETWEELQKMRPDLQVLFASGYADGPFLRRLPPGTSIVDKPFQMHELLHRIRETLDA